MKPWVTRLIAANVVLFFLQQFSPQVTGTLILVPSLIPVRPGSAVTYMFLHGSLLHIGFNMLSLYFFGPGVESRLGTRRFLILYMISGIGGAVLSAVFPYSRHVPIHHTDRDSLVLTIRGKKDLIDQLPFTTENNVIGFLEVYPIGDMNQHHELFFEKYANRIGFNIHNRFLVEKNLEHLRFIRSLVGDIEHNIIAPNMIYKLFLKHLRKKIMKNRELEGLLAMYLARGREAVDPETLMEELREVNRGPFEELENIEKHYQHMSLFLETLLRRSHFDRGQLTLIKKPCNIKKDVVQPQLDRFAERFHQMGIHIDDRLSGIPDEDVISVVDVGLIAQVYANFFTNALKYTREVATHSGEKLKYISYGREVLGDYFGPGKDGIKYNV